MTKRTTAEVRRALWETFPACFAAKGQSKAPLKIGIYHDIKSAGGFTGAELGHALHDYTTGPTYLRNVVVDADRIDLDGKPVGNVTEDEAAFALTRLGKINRRSNRVRLPVQHASDCACHNEPALPKGPCDCGAIKP